MNPDYVQYKTLLMAQCVRGLIRWYDFKGLYQEAEFIFRQAVERVRPHTAASETDRATAILFFRVLGARGQFLRPLGNCAEGVSVVKEALAVAERIEVDAEMQVYQAALFRSLGDNYLALSDYRSAFDAYNQSLAVALEATDQPGIAMARRSLAWIAIQQGKFDDAENQAQEALHLYQELGRQRDIAFTLNILGTIAIRTSRYEQAEQYYEQSLRLRRQSGHPREIAESLNDLGTLFSETAKMEQAQQCYEECLSVLQESGYRAGIANVLNNLGTLFAKQGQYEQAQQYFEQSLQLRREIGDQYGVATSLNNLGAIARYFGAYEEARRYVEESLALHTEIAHRPGSVFCLDNLGYITLAQEDFAAAWRYFRMALQEAMEVKAIILILDALTGIAGLLIQSGGYPRAAQLLGLALNHPAVQAETHTNAKPFLDALRQALNEEQLVAEMERGKSLDLQEVVTEIVEQKIK
jgi:tetratricopeptide (TPR) repeat protein